MTHRRVGAAIFAVVFVTTLISVTTSATAGSVSLPVVQDDAPEDDLPPGAGRIIGSPEAGPKPQHSGDRGGVLQLVTFGALATAVGFIAWRIATGIRRT